MSLCYEFLLECEVKGDVGRETMETLEYMTRSQEYDFNTPRIPHALFQETLPNTPVQRENRKITILESGWRTILTNFPREGEQYLVGPFANTFREF